ncbi:amino acid permease-domain-containing protein [Aspergillus tetrazonus]
MCRSEAYNFNKLNTMATSVPERKGESKHDSSNGTDPDIITGILPDTGTTDADDLILQANGHKPQLRRQFNWLSALGLGFSITNSWVGYLSNFGQSMKYGGPRLVIVGLLLAFIAQSIISIGLAEIGSAFPSSGGQYHFCFLLAPRRSRRFAAYVIGWMSVVAWWVTTNPCLRRVQQDLSYLPDHLAFIYRRRSNDAFRPYRTDDGQIALHIAEEMQHPGRHVPQIIITTLMIGLATTLPLFIALLLFSSDTVEIMDSPLPSAELIHQATGSRAGTMFLIIWILIVYISCLPSQWVTSGRLAWAFARDNGTPFPRYFSAISPTFQFPVRTTTAAFVFVLLYGLLYLASTTAFNSIITSAVLFLNITYAAPQGILLLRRARSLLASTSKTNTNMSILPPRYLNLGILLGSFCNAFSILWIIVLGVFVCFPPEIPVNLASANYTPAVVVGIFGLILLFWGLGGREMFKGPQVDWEGLELGLRVRASLSFSRFVSGGHG